MCGIFGIINLDGDTQRHDLTAMRQRIKHRGPDDDGEFQEDGIALGFVRLSILDLSKSGHQPMHSDDGNHVLIFNGEIFNYLEIRGELENLGYHFNGRSDTEVLLKAYLHWGEDCLNRLNGMWAFLVYDRKAKTIFVARDRFGIKPFYYFLSGSKLIFASEIASILAHPDVLARPNKRSIFDFLVFNRTDQTEHTFFEGVKKLQHGACFFIDLKTERANSALNIKKWYDLKANLKAPFESAEAFHAALKSAVLLRMRSDVPVGLCLSGGLDSSAILSILLSEGKSDVSTFSAVYDKGDKGDESEFINEYKGKVDKMFFTQPNADSFYEDIPLFVKAHSEPIPSTSAYAQFRVMKLAQNKAVVLLDGQGADEQLAGYHYFFGLYFKDLFVNGRILKSLSEIFAYLKVHRSLLGIKSFVFFLLPKDTRTNLRIRERGFLDKRYSSHYKASSGIAGNLYASETLQESFLDHFEYKLEHHLKWNDCNSMWFSLEARVPFLDHLLVEKTLTLPSEQVINRGITKSILREALKGVLPERIRMRNDKIGFATPEGEWFRKDVFKNFIEDILDSSSLRSRGIIDVEKAKKIYKKHLSGRVDLSKEIWKIVHLELWYREYIDRPLNGKKLVCSKGLWDHTVPGIMFDKDGVSNYAKIQQDLMRDFPGGAKGIEQWTNIVNKIKSNGKGKTYDCVIGVSGGTDSSYLLHLAKEYGLRPLAINLDNGWNSDIALKNIKKMTQQLNIDLETYVINYEEIKDILRSYLLAGLPWIDNPTDQAINAILYKIARREGLKTILIGSDFRSEGKQPTEWTYSDQKQLQFINKKFGRLKLETYPRISILTKMFLGYVKGIKVVSPYYYLSYNKQAAQELLIKKYDWQYYGEHHHENVFTKWVIGYWLYEKFGIDKRIITYSAQVLNGAITREEGLRVVSAKPYNEETIAEETDYVLKKLDLTKEQFDLVWRSPNKFYWSYPSNYPFITKFVRWVRPLATKILKVKPKLFYELEHRS